MIAEERKKETEVEAVYKTKVVQFFGRSVPIILQNDNGPCPLIAISNVLLLRNNLNLSVDTSEVSLQNLLSLVAGRIIDANSNVQGKDAEYVENQQQNIGDAINLLPRLATGLDVNPHFTRIDGFEFTSERAIFDLLAIELYHGWIVDPQDIDTLNAIGSKAYNALAPELIALESGNAEGEDRANPEDDSIDFRAATTAALGVPSPCLSRGRSFDEPPVSVAADGKVRKGDMEEQEELDRALELSKASTASSLPSDLPDSNLNGLSTISEEITYLKTSDARVLAENFEHPSSDEFQRSNQPEFNLSQDFSACSTSNSDGLPSAILSAETAVSIYKTAPGDCHEQSNSNESVSSFISTGKVENIRTGVLASNETEPFLFPDRDASVASYPSKGDQKILHSCPEEIPMSMNHLQLNDNQSSFESTGFPGRAVPSPDSDSSDGAALLLDVSEGVASSLEGSEPIYEGEERILDSGHLIYESREPMYEGEVILAEQADRGAQGDGCSPNSTDEVAPRKRKGLLSINAEQGELIRNFLKNNASQLTVYGLFCLQEGLKEHELCVFFRNNHFSTMFKFNGELYLLATDQGYINQPDLVWEKLNEVNGDSIFMTGNFKEFTAENQASDLWDERSAVTNTADYLASIDGSAPDGSTLNSDLQLAIALQQQEFENQPQRQNPNNVQQSHVGGQSRLVTGPQDCRMRKAYPIRLSRVGNFIGGKRYFSR